VTVKVKVVRAAVVLVVGVPLMVSVIVVAPVASVLLIVCVAVSETQSFRDFMHWHCKSGEVYRP